MSQNCALVDRWTGNGPVCPRPGYADKLPVPPMTYPPSEWKWSYKRVRAPDGHPSAGSCVYEHRLVAESALGRPLPKGAEVHHLDLNGKNNAPSNLVICQDRAYHKLLHQRDRALRESGNADLRQCIICRRWCHPDDLYFGRSESSGVHRECRAAEQRARRWDQRA